MADDAVQLALAIIEVRAVNVRALREDEHVRRNRDRPVCPGWRRPSELVGGGHL